MKQHLVKITAFAIDRYCIYHAKDKAYMWYTMVYTKS